ncbi:ABC transporter permease subunit [Bacillus benzoevorans]|uniref:Autoinducer 2 import system permease protein LsrD n=1 Tax=Bacillus benzoevorans TaxID=1456 RepID=A0A7X0HNM9_9BACI|nr:AI-2 transport system permease protein [Bacillus benzoevorans]
MLKKGANWNVLLFIVLISEIVVFGLINPRFWNISILLNSFNDFIGIAVIAFFVTFVVITGGIDISGGSIIGLTSVVTGILAQVIGVNIWIALIVGILTGGFCGLLNGIFIAYAKVPAMVLTLGGMLLYSGAALVLVGFSGASTYEGISGFSQEFTNLANGKLFGIPHSAILFIIMLLAAYILLHLTRYGRYIYLIGVNQNAAEYAGINTRKIITSTYVLSGISAGIAGVMLTSYLGSARADFGAEYLMPILTAVVLGGTIITGGKGGVIGTALASIIIGFLKLGLQMAGVQTQYIGLAIGLLLIISVSILGVSEIKSRVQRLLSGKNIKEEM